MAHLSNRLISLVSFPNYPLLSTHTSKPLRRALRSTAMASITLLSLAPAVTLLHLPASTSLSTSFVAAPGPISGRRSVVLRALPRRCVTVVCSAAAAEAAEAEPAEKFRLDNLGPQKGSRRRPKRKGRGIAAGQGASCGFGMRGQKSRSGPGVRRGFEGGQMPLYRRIPKLRGIAGGESLRASRFPSSPSFEASHIQMHWKLSGNTLAPSIWNAEMLGLRSDPLQVLPCDCRNAYWLAEVCAVQFERLGAWRVQGW